MKMTGEQYWKLAFKQQELELTQKALELEEKEYLVKNLYKRIFGLEALLVQHKITEMKQKKRDRIDGLNAYRKEIADELKIENIEKYLVNPDTYELTIEDDVVEKL